jgi:threonyl-tRNA synthetase
MSRLTDKLPKHRILLNPKSYRMAHPVYSKADIEGIATTFRMPTGWPDKLAKNAVTFCRASVDFMTRYNPDKMTERGWLNRVIFLETVAGVPGMVGGMHRHFRSLRTCQADHGWIHHLLEEAENERMHLFFFVHLRKPGYFFKFFITAAQIALANVNFLMYFISPKFCHRFVGYLEEQAVHTYTVLLKNIDEGKLP